MGVNRATRGTSLAGAIQLANGAKVFDGTTSPLSGTSGTGAASANAGSIYVCTTTGVAYVNEGTKASPYWTPLNYAHPSLFGAFTDFRDGVGKAHSDTAATYTIPGSGVRVHGQGIAETDSGLVITQGEGGPVGRITTTDEDAHLIALGFGGTTVPFQPDTHGPLVIDAEVTLVSALTLRRLFCGFVGTAADALDPPVTGATVTLTLVQDDVAGIFMDAALTAATGLFAAHNKSDEAASILVSATGVDMGAVVPAAGTFVRLRVEISRAGVMTCFVDKVQKTRIAASLDVDEEVAPCLLVGSTTTAVKAMDVKRFATWGVRG